MKNINNFAMFAAVASVAFASTACAGNTRRVETAEYGTARTDAMPSGSARGQRPATDEVTARTEAMPSSSARGSSTSGAGEHWARMR